MRILRLDHVQLAMPAGREADARAYYSGVLGLDEIEKPEPLKSRGGCWFEAQGFQVHLGVQADFRPATKAHPAFVVADLPSAEAALRLARAPVRHDASVATMKRLFTEDPFGNRIEILEAEASA